MSAVAVGQPAAVRARTRRRAGRVVRWTALIAVGVLLALPYVWMVSTSLKANGKEFSLRPELIPDPAVWGNYGEIFRLAPFFQWFWNSVVIVVLTTTGRLVTASLAGYAFARLRFPLQRPMFALCLSTLMLPGIVTLIPEFIVFRYLNWTNSNLPLWVPAWCGGGAFFIFLCRQFFRTIPYELDEAAKVDGASPWTIYRRIILPLSVPVLVSILNWNDDTYGRFREEEKIKGFTEKNPKVKVTLRLFRQNYRDTLLTQIAGGQGADVFRLDVPDMYPFADQGTIPDLSARMMDKDHWYASPDTKKEVFDGLKYRGKLHGLAIGLDSNALEVNGTLFDEAKEPRPAQSYSDKGWNMEAVLEAAKKLTKREGDTPVQYGINADLDAWQLAGFIWASGGQSLSDDLTTLMWDQEPALKAIQFMADLVNVHKVAPAPSGGDAKTFGYTTGKLAMQWSYPSQLTYRYNAKLPWDWTLAPEPQAGAPRTTVLYNLWTINAKSKNADEAWALASYLAGPQGQRVDTELGWGMPAFKSLDEAYYKRILKDYPNKNIKPGLEDLQYIKGWYDPHMQPGWSEAERKHIKPVFDEVVLGKKTAKQAVAEFKPQVDKLLKEGAAKLKG